MSRKPVVKSMLTGFERIKLKDVAKDAAGVVFAG